MKNVAFPLDASRVTGEQTLVIIHARDLVMQRCLAKYGFDVPMRPPVNQESSELMSFGLTDETDARTYGYMRKPKETGPEFITEVPPDATPILTGEVSTFGGTPVPEGGCQGESMRAVTGGDDRPKDGNLAEQLRHEAWIQAQRDSRVVPLFEEWRSCLQDAGFPEFRDPGEPFSYWQGRRVEKASEPSQEEISMAVADVECKSEVELMPTWMAAVYAYQQRLAAANAEQLDAYREYIHESIERASDIVSGD